MSGPELPRLCPGCGAALPFLRWKLCEDCQRKTEEQPDSESESIRIALTPLTPPTIQPKHVPHVTIAPKQSRWRRALAGLGSLIHRK